MPCNEESTVRLHPGEHVGGREVQRYGNEQIRISILWKGRVAPDGPIPADEHRGPLTAERIVEIIWSDLVSR
jgi:hypothetical protein